MRLRFAIMPAMVMGLGTAALLMNAHAAPPKAWVTPTLPGGKQVVTDTSPDFLKAPGTIMSDVKIAKTAPTVDFAYFPCQTYAAEIWSSWGESCCADGKYYTTLGDHMYPGKAYPAGFGPDHTCAGTAFLYEFDPATKTLRQLLDTNKLLKLPAETYAPAKFHARLEMGKDGMLYGATHRGAERTTNEKYNYKGDWILKINPKTAQSEVVVHAPVPMHCIPCGMLDPERLIYYGGTAAGTRDKEHPENDMKFFAYDLQNKKVLYQGSSGPYRAMMLAKSGKVYFTPGAKSEPLMCYDPSSGKPPYEIPGQKILVRAATRETPQGIIYVVSQGGLEKGEGSTLFAFDTKTEKVTVLGPITIDNSEKPIDYVASLVADPTGRYLYYTIGAHGGSEKIGSSLIQYDTKSNTKKVIAFLSPFYEQKYGVIPTGSFNIAIDEKGETAYITWNSRRPGAKAWDVVAMTAVHIPESERQP